MRATSAARAEKRRTPRSIRALCGVVRGDATSPCNRTRRPASSAAVSDEAIQIGDRVVHLQVPGVFTVVARRGAFFEVRSEEHTSELQSHSDLVCRLLLEKKKK